MQHRSLVRRVYREEGGATMTEYGLLVALIAIVLIAAVTFFGEGVDALFNRAGDEMNSAANT